MRCRACGAPLTRTLVDFGTMPLANGYLPHPDAPDPRYPLCARVCDACLLVQADPVVDPTVLFSDYHFFSGASRSWVEHARLYAKTMTNVLDLGPESQVVELASNDGTLLAQFEDVPVLGIEPAANVAATATVPTVTEFFTAELAPTLPQADLLIANNVLGHVPDLHDFAEGMRIVLGGVATIEVPHLGHLLRECEFDTIYHEHFSYFSLAALERLLYAHGLRVFDVERLAIHGGSLRLHVCHADAGRGTHPRVLALRREEGCSIANVDEQSYGGFAGRVRGRVQALRHFLEDARAQGKTVVGAGAPAKANTLLNAAKITTEEGLIAYVTDTTPAKQGTYLPGSHLPVVAPETILADQPDYLLILAWNWAEEIQASLHYATGRFVVPTPAVKIL